MSDSSHYDEICTVCGATDAMHGGTLHLPCPGALSSPATPEPASAPGGEVGPFGAVMDEVRRATAKFPTWPTDPLHALAVLGEEFGELTKETLQLTYEPHKSTIADFRKEAHQTAAMALRFLASLDSYQFAPGPQHQQAALSNPAPGHGEAPVAAVVTAARLGLAALDEVDCEVAILGGSPDLWDRVSLARAELREVLYAHPAPAENPAKQEDGDV